MTREQIADLKRLRAMSDDEILRELTLVPPSDLRRRVVYSLDRRPVSGGRITYKRQAYYAGHYGDVWVACNRFGDPLFYLTGTDVSGDAFELIPI